MMKMQSGGQFAKRIIADDGSLLGLALELANGRWAPFDTKETRLVDISVTFKSPNAVLKFFKMAADGKGGGAS